MADFLLNKYVSKNARTFFKNNEAPWQFWRIIRTIDKKMQNREVVGQFQHIWKNIEAYWSMVMAL